MNIKNYTVMKKTSKKFGAARRVNSESSGNRVETGHGAAARFVPTPVKVGDTVYIVAVPNECGMHNPLILKKTVESITRHPETERSAVIISGDKVALSVGGPAYTLRRNKIAIAGVYGAGTDVMKYGWRTADGSFVCRKEEDALLAYEKYRNRGNDGNDNAAAIRGKAALAVLLIALLSRGAR